LSEEIGQIVLDFQTINFESDLGKLRSFLSRFQEDLEKSRKGSDTSDGGFRNKPTLFDVSPPKYVGGWYFSKLRLSPELTSVIYQQNSTEIENIDIKKTTKSLGKQYRGDDSLARFATWLDQKLKGLGCQAQIKIGEEMADFGYGVAQSIFGLTLGRLLDNKFARNTSD
jgi:hypothetical protein